MAINPKESAEFDAVSAEKYKCLCYEWCTDVSSPDDSFPDDSSLYRKKLYFTVY